MSFDLHRVFEVSPLVHESPSGVFNLDHYNSQDEGLSLNFFKMIFVVIICSHVPSRVSENWWSRLNRAIVCSRLCHVPANKNKNKSSNMKKIRVNWWVYNVCMISELVKILKRVLNLTNHTHAHIGTHVHTRAHTHAHMHTCMPLACTYVATWWRVFTPATSTAMSARFLIWFFYYV